MRPRPVVGEATVPDAVRRLLDKFDYPDRESPEQVVPILPTLGAGSGTGAFIHLTRNATQSIASASEEIDWDTLGLQGVSGFTQAVPTTTVTIQQAGYYNIGVLLGWSSFTEGGTITIFKNGVTVWAPTDDPGLWSTTDGQYFEGTAHAIQCVAGDTLSVNVNPDDASAQTLASATLAVYLVDRAPQEGAYRELVLSHGPVAYWRLDETSGTTFTDIAGHASGPFNMTSSGGPTLGEIGLMQDGSGNAAADFEADSDEYATATETDILKFLGTLPFSAEAWVKPESHAESAGDNTRAIVSCFFSDGVNAEDGWRLAWYAGDENGPYGFMFQRHNGASENQVLETLVYSTAPATAAQYVVGTYDGTTLSLYVNGVLIGTDATVLSLPDGDQTRATIAATNGGTPGIDDFTSDGQGDGVYDEIAVYDRALSTTEILEHFTVGRSG